MRIAAAASGERPVPATDAMVLPLVPALAVVGASGLVLTWDRVAVRVLQLLQALATVIVAMKSVPKRDVAAARVPPLLRSVRKSDVRDRERGVVRLRLCALIQVPVLAGARVRNEPLPDRSADPLPGRQHDLLPARSAELSPCMARIEAGIGGRRRAAISRRVQCIVAARSGSEATVP